MNWRLIWVKPLWYLVSFSTDFDVSELKWLILSATSTVAYHYQQVLCPEYSYAYNMKLQIICKIIEVNSIKVYIPVYIRFKFMRLHMNSCLYTKTYNLSEFKNTPMMLIHIHGHDSYEVKNSPDELDQSCMTSFIPFI